MESNVETAEAICTGDGTKCVECGKLFSHEFYFGTHIVTHLAEKQFRPVGQCGMCGLVFSDSTVYQAHMMSLQSRLDAMTAEDESVEENVQEPQQQQQHSGTTNEGVQPDFLERSPSPVEQDRQDEQQPQQPALSTFSEKDQQHPPPRQESKHSLPHPGSSTAGAKRKVETEPEPEIQSEQETKCPPVAKSQHGPKSQQGSSKPPGYAAVPAVKEEPVDVSDVSVSGELPRKRVRRAPDKYEVLHEEKKRRAPKRKAAIPPSPGYDPEVEKYLQSLRDMGFSVAPDTVDTSHGRQAPAPPVKRGRGTVTARGRGMPRGTHHHVAPPRPTLQPQRPFNNFSGAQRGRGGPFSSPRGFVGMGNSVRKFSPHTLVRSSSQPVQHKSEGINRTMQAAPAVVNKSRPATRGFPTNRVMTSHGMPGRVKQEFLQSPSSTTYNKNYSMSVNNRPIPVPAPLPPKPKAFYRDYDYEDEIINLINGDLEIMPVSGKQTRGERLKQRQERLSQDGSVEGAKKSVKYFPRTEKAKGKRSPKKGSSPPSKHQRIIPPSEMVSPAGNIQADTGESDIQITNVHSLQPTTSSFGGRRGTRVRGRRGRWVSNSRPSTILDSRTLPGHRSSFESKLNRGNQQQGGRRGGKEFVTTSEVVTICNVGGRMEDLREEARKKVEEMLAAPGTFLMEDITKLSAVPPPLDRGRQGVSGGSGLSRPAPRQNVFAPATRFARGRARTRSRGRSSSRGRGSANRGRSVKSGHLFQSHVAQKETTRARGAASVAGDRKEAKEGDRPSEVLINADEDKEEIVDGADIDGWTVSISQMSDSEGEGEKITDSEMDTAEKKDAAEEKENDGGPDLKDGSSAENAKDSDQDNHTGSTVKCGSTNSDANSSEVRKMSEETESTNDRLEVVGDDKDGKDKHLKDAQPGSKDKDGDEVLDNKQARTGSSFNVKKSNSISDMLASEETKTSVETDESNGVAHRDHEISSEIDQISSENVTECGEKLISDQNLESRNESQLSNARNESQLSNARNESQLSNAEKELQISIDKLSALKSDGPSNLDSQLEKMDSSSPSANEKAEGSTRSKSPDDFCQTGKNVRCAIKDSDTANLQSCRDKSKDDSIKNSDGIEDSLDQDMKETSHVKHYHKTNLHYDQDIVSDNSVTKSKNIDQQPDQDDYIMDSDETAGRPDQLMKNDNRVNDSDDIDLQADQGMEKNDSVTKMNEELDQNIKREESVKDSDKVDLQTDQLTGQSISMNNSRKIDHLLEQDMKRVDDCDDIDLKQDDFIEKLNEIQPHSSQNMEDKNRTVNVDEMKVSSDQVVGKDVSNKGSDSPMNFVPEKAPKISNEKVPSDKGSSNFLSSPTDEAADVLKSKRVEEEALPASVSSDANLTVFPSLPSSKSEDQQQNVSKPCVDGGTLEAMQKGDRPHSDISESISSTSASIAGDTKQDADIDLGSSNQCQTGDDSQDKNKLQRAGNSFDRSDTSSGTEMQTESSSASLQNSTAESTTKSALACSPVLKGNSEKVESDSSLESSSQNMTRVDQNKVIEDAVVNERGNSGNVYDDTDNFSEIEKTCQEIIRDAENQEEERRANLENSS